MKIFIEVSSLNSERTSSSLELAFRFNAQLTQSMSEAKIFENPAVLKDLNKLKI